MRYQIQFRDQHGSIKMVGCFTKSQVTKVKRELRMNGTHSTVVEIDQRCVFCGGDDGWECCCAGAIMERYKPEVDPSLLNPNFISTL